MPVTYRNKVAPFEVQQLIAISKVLGHTSDGLIGPEIELALRQLGIPDPTPTCTKWKRLFNALVEFQNQHQIGNHVVRFIVHVMNPSSYTSDPTKFHSRREQLNPIMALCGMHLREDGKVCSAAKATTLDEALQRAGRMHAELQRRSVHPEVLRFCKAEIIQNNNFHAPLEAMKSITARLRNLCASSLDGKELVLYAFARDQRPIPRIAVNALETKTHQGEHVGFMNLLIGLYGMIRNPLAHEPKIEWEMSEQDAMDVMTTISMVHRKLDKAYQCQGDVNVKTSEAEA